MLRQSGPYITDEELEAAYKKAISKEYERKHGYTNIEDRLDCRLFPNFNIFFDGTGNNLNISPNNKSNIARLFMARRDSNPVYDENFYRYITGVGTPYKPKDNPEVGEDKGGAAGLGTGKGGEMRLQDALLYIEKRLNEKYTGAAIPHVKMIDVNIFGFSRGATLARAFVHKLLNERCEVEGYDVFWTLPSYGNRLPLRINFLGLFDTVASVGWPGGHWSWASELRIPNTVNRCVQLVAAHELRKAFPLDSIAFQGSYPSNSMEVIYPGVHSDIGGGYFPDEQGRSEEYSRITLREMYLEAIKANVPIRPISSIRNDKKLANEFYPSSVEVIDKYHNYISNIDQSAKSITEGIMAHRPVFFKWRSDVENNDQTRLLGSFKDEVNCDQCLATPEAKERRERNEQQWKLAEMKSSEEQSKELIAEHKRLVKQVEFMRNPFTTRGHETEPRDQTDYEKLILSAWDNSEGLQVELSDFFENYLHDSVAAFHYWPCSLYDQRGIFMHKAEEMAQNQPPIDEGVSV
ncbi:T6SS phospholipase effector Tle1-like catalytic domain-containing protein [Paludibacterium denitrificans]|uniref:DUF2235 domain-containing protein n=1 Tax=Paludibacterium denitrificans TaxID=2675226 RepID=A0A844GDQ1_9NEIS|nr:DUF2235 domain-containing protein [Paludibacterium denitrificans]MTD33440.1 DUF2235 domain-containing protein [Paludibacterium denitrificans]